MCEAVWRFLRRLTLLVSVAMAYWVTPIAAQSDGTGIVDAPAPPPTFAIAPSGEVEGAYFSATMEPGTEQSMTATLANMGEIVFEARTFAADAYTIVNGGMGVREDGSEPTGVTTWIDYPAEALTLEPHTTVERSFTVAVPEGTAPGQYITGIVLQTAEPLPVAGSTTFDQILRKTVAVFITVPGPASPGMMIGNASLLPADGRSALTIEVANTGNVLIRPVGEVVLRDSSGDTVLTVPVAMGPVYAGHRTTIEILIQQSVPVGEHTLDISLADEEHRLTESSSAAVTVLPLAAPEPPPPLAIGDIALAAMPSPGEIQYLDVGVKIANNGEPVTDARLVLHVRRDGELVEAFPLASSLALAPGTTVLQQRYIPGGGWAPGDYAFAVTLETVDPANGAAVVIAEAAVDEVLTVPRA